MSIIRKLEVFLRYVELDYKYNSPQWRMKSLLSLFSLHGLYAMLTTQTHLVTITDKYIIPTLHSGGGEFRIITSDNKHITISQSLWYWVWNDAERWSRFKKNETYRITTYGWRIPLLGMFPQQIR